MGQPQHEAQTRSARQPERIPIGIKELDDALEGGIPKGSWVVVTGEPGVGKSILCMHFAYAGVKAGDPVVYVTTEQEFRDVVLQARQLGMNFDNVYSLTRKEPPEKTPQMVVVDFRGLMKIASQLNAGRKKLEYYHNTLATSVLIEAINRAVRILGVEKEEEGGEDMQLITPTKHVRLVIDTLSVVWIDNPVIHGFNHDLKKKLHQNNITILSTMYKNSPLYENIEYVVDGVIHMWMEDEKEIKRYLIIRKMKLTNHSRRAISFEIEPGRGIAIK